MGDHVGDVMTSPAVTIGPGKTISEAARVMDEKKVKRLPVVDDSGHLLGIISRADIVRVVSGNMKGCR
jgi:CBS domain-containing protein